MKKMALVLALTMIALVGTAAAQDPNWSDNIGVYFDEAATNNCGTLDPFTEFPAFLVFTQVSAPTIKSWEVLLAYNNLTKLSFEPRHQHILVAPRAGETMVGLAEAQPVVGGNFVAADLLLLTKNNMLPATITANGVFFHLLPARVPAYQDANDNGFELHPVNGEAGSPILSINTGGCVVSEETNSFGSVKSLFR